MSKTMEIQVPFFSFFALCLFVALSPEICTGSVQRTQISPGFKATQISWIDNEGLFLLSNGSTFAFGFVSMGDPTTYLLAVIHQKSKKTVWAANRGALINNTDVFAFGNDGDVVLQSGNTTVWSSGTSKKGASSMILDDSGNLVLLSNNSDILWQSFDHPTDTLLSGQRFVEGMQLVSDPNSSNLSFYLEFGSGDVNLFANFVPQQQYWSMHSERRAVMNKASSVIYSANLTSNSWNFYDRNQDLLLQFIFSTNTDLTVKWAATLSNDGFISFTNLQSGNPEMMKIPKDSCDTPEACKPYQICISDQSCQCPTILSSDQDCNPDIVNACGSTNSSLDLAKVGDGLGYFAVGFTSPVMKSSLTNCKEACLNKCSCLALFFDDSSGNCFMFSQIGSLQQSISNQISYTSYIKVSNSKGGNTNSNSQNGSGGKHVAVIAIVIALVTVLVVIGLIYAAKRCLCNKKQPMEHLQGSSEEDNFLENISGMPVRFTYGELQVATDNFSMKLGQGGFGSVYQGKLPDGTRIAVKKLERIGQGKKEFRAEVSIIGSIHHVHLVRLRGFCAEGSHRLLAYEYMAGGSLERWIFHNQEGRPQLDWNKRFNIALGTAKGLAYLHEDCDSKIVHCDIKPENVLLDDNFLAKVSDFGLAKLMTREQSHVFTTLRGTRGYLAPEWITNYAISEKSDVYSFGMVLLEIIGGRKNFDPAETSEKAHFPTYAFKKMEEGRLKEILDAKLDFDEKDERVMIAIKVALWCIQEDMAMRPSMTKVVQMLEGVTDVPQPPPSSQMGFRLYANLYKSISSEGTSSGPSDCNSDAFISAVRLSGPR